MLFKEKYTGQLIYASSDSPEDEEKQALKL